MSNKREAAGAAWAKSITSKSGQELEILSISIGDKKYTAFRNSYKVDGDKQPDWKLYEDTYTPKADAKPAPKKSFAGQDDLPF